jgi:DNA-binding transcriptional LysR family regulator
MSQLVYLMAMNTESLKAFLVTTETGSFTKAAGLLGLTQSALSQKMARLESDLEVTLFIRGLDGITLTISGEKLLIHARQQIQLEEEFLRGFQTKGKELSGHLRIAGFSSIMRSLVIPKVAPWLCEHHKVRVEFSSHEVYELPDILRANKADMIFTDFFPHLSGVVQEIVGEEEYVLIESKKHKSSPDIYLDHYPKDNATESFFVHQGQKFNYPRSFMGDVYGILDGVALGLGKAVMSRHMVENDPRFRILKSKRRFTRPIVLNYFHQSYYPTIHRQAHEIFRSKL